jgi:hypothetical protein
VILRSKTLPDLRGSRRAFMQLAAAGLSTAAASRVASAQFVPPPVSPGQSDDNSSPAPVSIEVKASPIP